MEAQPTAHAGERPGSLLALAVWAGILTGFGELAKVGIDLFYSDFVNRSRDAVWMIPAFDAGLFALVGLVLVLIGVRIRVPWAIAAGLFAGLGTLLILLLVQRLHPLAAVAVAAGAGTQIARLAERRVPVASRLVRRSLPWLVGVVVVLGVATVSWRQVAERRLADSRPRAVSGAPNVLLLILDTVRAADLSLYGYARLTTPQLQHFAEGGAVFDRAFSVASWTLPSHASIFTGQWETALHVSWWDGLDEQWLTLTEALHARGYATAAFVANVGYVGWESGLSQGFEHYDDHPVTLWTATTGTAFGMQIYPRLRRVLAPALTRMPLLWRLRWPKLHEPRSAEKIGDSFLSWLDHGRPAPFFAFLNFMDAHMPYAPPDSFRSRFRSPLVRPVSRYAWLDEPPVRLTPADVRPKQDVYDGSIAYLDSQLGHLFRELDRRGRLNNTLVIVTADHGDEFAEHGFVDHGNTLYRLSVQVPLVVWFPGRVPPGRRVAQPISLRNLAATVLDLTAPGWAPLPGRSLARFWMPGGDTTADTIVASVHRPDGLIASVAFDSLRYIRTDSSGTEELYDFNHDLLERWNLVESEAGRRLLPRYRAALGVTTPANGEALTQGGGKSGRSWPMPP
jgi:arylsulfatase A-like enzyme